VIAKLDRLSRNAAFLLKLRDTGVKFVAADMPEATDTVIGIMALIAQDERERISQRTKDGLAEARKRGVRLGNPNGAAPLRRAGKGNRAAVASLRAQADERARDMAPILADIVKGGTTTHRGIRDELNEREIPSPRQAMERGPGGPAAASAGRSDRAANGHVGHLYRWLRGNLPNLTL
jgi:DNA invertase Pin-like site-specific DNA recombinase